MKLHTIAAVAALAAATSFVSADQVIFKNGDKLTGKIETLADGKLKITSAVAGEILVDMKDVATFSTDVPVEIQTADGRKIHEPVSQADSDQVKTAAGEVISLLGVQKINPPREKWTGSLLINGSISRGNTRTDDLGMAFAATLRRENERTDDRFTLGAAYNYGRQEDDDTGDMETSTDNWNALGKYDRFWTEKIYTYALFKVEHDRIADLDYRLSPGVGVGYQWIETPDMNFYTEAGVSYVYEEFASGDSDEYVAARLAYHFDKQLNDVVTVFHNFEILPAFEDPTDDYTLTADAGLRAKLTKVLFTELKVEWKRDNTPAPDAAKDDVRYILGLGWMF